MDLRQMPVKVLEKKFGKYGLKMHQLSMGIDEREVVADHEVKSISHEETFSQDIQDIDAGKKEILRLSNKVAHRARKMQAAGRTITLKVKYSDFRRITRAETLSSPTDDGFEIYSTACRLLRKTAVGMRPVRLLGISLSQLSFHGKESQFSLFDRDEQFKKRKSLNMALDSLYEKHGENSVRPGTLLEK